MTTTLKMTAAFLDSKNVKYEINEDDNSINTGFCTDNKGGMPIHIHFDEDGTTLCIHSYNYVSFPAGRINDMYKLCNRMNFEYRWVKFSVDESDNTITLSDDAVVQDDSVGEEVWELISRLVGLGDDVYPAFMKAVWS